MTENRKVILPFIIRPENISRYENGEVLILDRRVYPFEVQFVRCKTVEETAKAIEDMVTQSAGPMYVAGHGVVLAAHLAVGLPGPQITEALEQAARRLIKTRPTNNSVQVIATKMVEIGKKAIAGGLNVEETLKAAMELEFEERQQTAITRGQIAASLLKDGDCVLNHCWSESGIVYTLVAALQQGKKLSAYCTETRPYLQGARLTADAIAELGIPTTVITDGMPGYLLSQGKVSVFMSGCDRLTVSGHVFNKVGTFQIALACHHFGVPYYAFSFGPDKKAPRPEDVEVEERDPEEVLHCRGLRTATTRAKGYYPAFDITPPEFVSAVITPRGIFSPYALANY